MKNLSNFLLSSLLLTNLSFILALNYGFYPIETIETRGNSANDNFGYSVSSAGDLNKDGYDDVLIGAYGKNSNKGVVYVIYGGEIPSKPLGMPSAMDFTSFNMDPNTNGFIITGGAASAKLGVSVSSAGDIDGDGYGDIVIGALGYNSNRGAVYVIYGAEKSNLPNLDLGTANFPLSKGFAITGNPGYNLLGCAVSAGDINKDGHSDIIIGAYGLSTSKGAVYVIYGEHKSAMSNIALASITLVPSTTGFVIVGASPDDEFGSSVHGTGDINPFHGEYSFLFPSLQKYFYTLENRISKTKILRIQKIRRKLALDLKIKILYTFSL